jgi:hypothetical protein
MIENREAFEKEKEELRNKEQNENRGRIKRFDDIFKMLFLVITIMISFGSQSPINLNLWNNLYFIVVPLTFWILGHAIGTYSTVIDTEAGFKLGAWAFASVAVSIVFLKFALRSPTLSYEWFFACVIFSIVITWLAFLYLKKVLSPYLKRNFMIVIVLEFFSLLYAVNMGTLTI